MGSRTTIEVAVRFHEPSWIIASVGGISRRCGLAVGIVLLKGHSHSIVSGTRHQLKVRDGAAPHRSRSARARFQAPSSARTAAPDRRVLLDPSQPDSDLPVVNGGIRNIRIELSARRPIQGSSARGVVAHTNGAHATARRAPRRARHRGAVDRRPCPLTVDDMSNCVSDVSVPRSAQTRAPKRVRSRALPVAPGCRGSETQRPPLVADHENRREPGASHGQPHEGQRHSHAGRRCDCRCHCPCTPIGGR
jgi:hypothetical protein